MKKRKKPHNDESKDHAKARAMASHERSMELKPEKYLFYWEREFSRNELEAGG